MTDVIIPITIVTIMAFVLPTLLHLSMEEGIVRLILVAFIGTFSSILSIEILGLTSNERTFINQKVIYIIKKLQR